MIDMEDREIDMSLLLKYLLKRWKYIGLVTILCALIGLGIGYKKYKSYKPADTYESGSVEYKAQMDKLYDSLSQDDRNRVDYAVQLNQKLIEIKKYMDTSYLMNADAYNCSEYHYEYNLIIDQNAYNSDFEKEGLSNQLRSAYANFVDSGELASELTKIYADSGLKESFFEELVSFSYNSTAWGDTSFSVMIKKVEDFKDLDQQVSQLVEAYTEKLNKKIANHKIEILETSVYKSKIDLIMDLQEKVRARYDNTRNAIRLLKQNNELSEDAIKCYESKIGEDGYHLAASTKGSSSDKKKIIKYTIFLMGIGFLMACGITILFYCFFIFDKYVVSKDDYSFLNLKKIGDLEDDYQTHIVVSTICKYSRDHNINKFVLISTDFSNIPRTTLNALQEELKKHNLEVVMVNGADMNIADLDQLILLNYCIFIERINATKIEDLFKLVNLCNDIEINIVGVVNIG